MIYRYQAKDQQSFRAVVESEANDLIYEQVHPGLLLAVFCNALALRNRPMEHLPPSGALPVAQQWENVLVGHTLVLKPSVQRAHT